MQSRKHEHSQRAYRDLAVLRDAAAAKRVLENRHAEHRESCENSIGKISTGIRRHARSSIRKTRTEHRAASVEQLVLSVIAEKLSSVLHAGGSAGVGRACDEEEQHREDNQQLPEPLCGTPTHPHTHTQHSASAPDVVEQARRDVTHTQSKRAERCRQIPRVVHEGRAQKHRGLSACWAWWWSAREAASGERGPGGGW